MEELNNLLKKSATNVNCIYLIHLCDKTYKIGLTNNMNRRLATHSRNFNSCELVAYVICNQSHLKVIEYNLLNYLNLYEKKDISYKNHREIFIVNDVPRLINKMRNLGDSFYKEQIMNKRDIQYEALLEYAPDKLVSFFARKITKIVGCNEFYILDSDEYTFDGILNMFPRSRDLLLSMKNDFCTYDYNIYKN